MKLIKATCYLLFAMLSLVFSGNLHAGTFIQNACWLVSDEGGPQQGDDMVILGVTDLGGGHYGFSGYVYSGDEQDDSSPQMLNGNGEIIGQQIIIGLQGIIDDTEATGTVSYYLRINLSDLNGTFQGVGTFYDKAGETVISDRGEGNLAITQCPS